VSRPLVAVHIHTDLYKITGMDVIAEKNTTPVGSRKIRRIIATGVFVAMPGRAAASESTVPKVMICRTVARCTAGAARVGQLRTFPDTAAR